MCVCLFFFFKQKTAYELRISDWSSDVCSSDLAAQLLIHPLPRRVRSAPRRLFQSRARGTTMSGLLSFFARGAEAPSITDQAEIDRLYRRHRFRVMVRSEEHTSELQSLMRISYAVFCLKKKNN